ncbi:nuclear transport factor 2 family protein [Rhodococcus opacus]|nr:nuclear transport factor 2 family protein [Rhodococcus opacus]
MTTVVNGVTLTSEPIVRNDRARSNIDVVIEFFSLYLRDKERFYALWVEDEPEVLTPYVANDVATCQIGSHRGWAAVRAFWDPIHDDMRGRFDWYIDDIIPGEDPDVVVVRSHSDVDVRTRGVWGDKSLSYQGRYVQIFRFEDGRVKSFEEYYDTAQLNAVYGA